MTRGPSSAAVSMRSVVGDADGAGLEPDRPAGARRSSATSQGRAISRGRSGTSCADWVVYRPSVQNWVRSSVVGDLTVPSAVVLFVSLATTSSAAFDPVKPVR